MKIKTLMIAALAASSASTFAQSPGESVLYGNGSGYVGALPVGVVFNDTAYAALVESQLGADCVGQETRACTPNISSLELASLLTSGSTNWAGLGVSGMTAADYSGPVSQASGLMPTIFLCGDVGTDDPAAIITGAAKVAGAHVGMDCSGGNMSSNNQNRNASTTLPLSQSKVDECMNTSPTNYAINNLELGGVAFAAFGEEPAGTTMVKLDGAYPDLSEFLAGNYSMFGDVHGVAPTTNASFVASADSPPSHAVLGTPGALDICAGGSGTADLSQ